MSHRQKALEAWKIAFASWYICLLADPQWHERQFDHRHLAWSLLNTRRLCRVCEGLWATPPCAALRSPWSASCGICRAAGWNLALDYSIPGPTHTSPCQRNRRLRLLSEILAATAWRGKLGTPRRGRPWKTAGI